MPVFEITAPDGRKFRVTAPEGAAKEDVLRYAQANMPAAQPEADDPGALQAGLIGAGRTVDRLIKGVKQPFLGAEAAAQLKGEEESNARIYAGLQEKRPIATMLGEVAPLVAGLPAVGGIGSAAVLGALPGALEYGAPEERAQRASLGAVGGAVGAGAGQLIGRVAQPFRPAVSETQQAAQDAAGRLGVQLRAGEITGSRPLRWAEAALNDLPIAGGMAQKAETARREAINAAGARSMGQQGTEITEGLFAKARDDIGNVFDNLLQNRQITLGPKFRSDVQKIAESKVLPALRDESTDAVIAPFQNMPAGKIKVSGEWFQQNKTALDQAIRGAYTAGENGKAKALEAFEDALVDAAKASMNTTERKAFEAAQKQWASLRLLETGKVVEAGNIMPGRLDSALINRYKDAYKEGKLTGELPDIGKLGQVYKPLPQSGTTPRAFYSGLASGAGLLNPLITAGAFAAPPLAQKFMQSTPGRNYLTKGMLDITPERERLLMQAGYGLLGLPATSSY